MRLATGPLLPLLLLELRELLELLELPLLREPDRRWYRRPLEVTDSGIVTTCMADYWPHVGQVEPQLRYS